MRNLCFGILSALLIVTFTQTASAAQSGFKKELDFTTGGQTIAGPGIAVMETGEAQLVFFIPGVAAARAAVCLTVANVGDVNLTFQLAFAGTFAVPPGRTRTLCHPATDQAFVECTGDSKTPRGATCEALWRVDEFHPVLPSDR